MHSSQLHGTWLLLGSWFLQVLSVRWMSPWSTGFPSAQSWNSGNSEGLTSVDWVKSGVAYGMLSYLWWLQVKCLWEDVFSGYRLHFSSSRNDLRWGRKKPVRAAMTVFVLMYYFTASVWGPGGTFSGTHSGVERTRALMTDSSGFESGSFKDPVTLVQLINFTGLSWWLRWLKKKKKICFQCVRHGFNPWVRKIPWKWLPTLVFLPGKSHGQRSLVGYSPWGF